MESIWTATASLPRFESLNGDIKTDVLIVGGGIAGVLCAYRLQQAGVNYALIEGERILNGITKNTTAKITSQHGLIYHKLLQKYGLEKAKGYLEANENAVKTYRKLCRNIDCDFEEKPSFVYAINKPKRIEKELEALERIGYQVKFVKDLPLPLSVSGAVRFHGQAQFHPLKFARAIVKGLRIYEETKALEFFPGEVVTNRGRIQTKKVIVATHFPIINKHGFYFLKMYQHRSYVLALKNAEDVGGMYVDEAQNGMSFRNYKDLLFIGGGDHRTGEKGGNWQELAAFAKAHYPQAKEAYRWATQDCITLDEIPYIGRYFARTAELYVATGFNKWGMTSAMVASELLCDMVLGKENPYVEIFSPQRSMLSKQLFINVGKAVINLLTPTAPRCPHMGCALKYNPQERSWDCPCHGSRFTEEKKVIDNPATEDMK